MPNALRTLATIVALALLGGYFAAGSPAGADLTAPAPHATVAAWQPFRREATNRVLAESDAVLARGETLLVEINAVLAREAAQRARALRCDPLPLACE